MDLTPAQEKYCLLRVEGATQKEAIEKVGRTAQTATAWQKIPEVRARIDELRLDILSKALDMLRHKVTKNIEIIQDIAESGGEPGVVPSRLKAAMWAVDKVLKLGEDNAISPAVRELAADLERLPEAEVAEMLERGT